MQDDDVRAALAKLGPEWAVDGQVLRKTFRFPDFVSALAFVNQVGALAEEDQHHPDLALSWGKVTVELTTHDAGGLSDKDFALATRIERV
jgi:4a-hydroxytetrahydrobiopterin dehydratase